MASSQSTSSPFIQIFSVGVMGMCWFLRRSAERAATWSPISVVEPVRLVASAQALRMRAAASASPRNSSISAADRMAAIGLALSWPAMSGAEPCTGSNIDGPVRAGLRLADEASPMPPRHRAAEVGEDVAEEVVGDDHVVALRVLHEVDAGGVDVVVGGGDVGVLGGDLVERALPEVAGEGEHVGLVHEREVLARAGSGPARRRSGRSARRPCGC